MNALQIIAKIRGDGNGFAYRLVRANGCTRFTLERFHKGEWLIGVNVNTNAARAASKRLTAQVGAHYTFWY